MPDPTSMLTLPAVLTHDAVAVLTRKLGDAVRTQATQVSVDAHALTEFDSSAIALLLECRRQALQAGKSFSVQGIPARMQQLAGVYGVAELLPENATS